MFEKIKKLAKYLNYSDLFKLAAEIATDFEQNLKVLNDYLIENNLNVVKLDANGIKNLVAYTFSQDPILKELAALTWEKCQRADLILMAFDKIIPIAVIIKVAKDIKDFFYQENLISNPEIKNQLEEFSQEIDEIFDYSIKSLKNDLKEDEDIYQDLNIPNLFNILRLQILNIDPYQNQEDLDTFGPQNELNQEPVANLLVDLSEALGYYNKEYAKNLANFLKNNYPDTQHPIYQKISNSIKSFVDTNKLYQTIKPNMNQDKVLNLHRKISAQGIIDPSIISQIIDFHLANHELHPALSRQILFNLARHPNTLPMDLMKLAKNNPQKDLIFELVKNPNAPLDLLLQFVNSHDHNLVKLINERTEVKNHLNSVK